MHDDARYRAMFDAGPPSVELDGDLRVLAVSRRARDLLGDCVGAPFLDSVRAGDRALFREAAEPLVEGQRGEADVQVRTTGRDSAEVTVDIGLSKVSPGRLLAVLTPSRADAHLALLSRTGQHLTNDGARAEAVHAVFADVAATLGFETFVHFVLDDPSTLRLAAWGGLEPWQREAFARLPVGEALCGRVAAEREPLVLEDLERSSLASVAAATIPGARCFVGVPLVAQGQLLGTVSFATRTRDRHKPGEVQVIRAVCDQAAIHLARAASERQLRERDLFFQLAVYNSLVTLCDWDIENDRVRRLHSVEVALPPTPDGAARFEDVTRVVHPDDRAQFEASVAEAIASADGKFRAEYRILRDDGEVRWLAENGQVEYAVVDGERRAVRLVCVALDVTERALAREELREREQHFRVALRAGHLGTWDWDLRAGMVELDDWAAASLGYPRGQRVISVNELASRIHPDDVEHTFALLMEHFEGRTEQFEFEHRAVNRSGAILWIFNRGQVVQRDSEGAAVRAIGTYTDVTASRRDADARRDAERRLATVLDASPLGFGLFDRELRYVQINAALARMNGVPAADHLGRTPREVLGEPGGDVVEPKVRRVFETGAVLVDDDAVLLHDDAYITQYLPIRVGDDITGVCCVVTDVSSLKRAEARARASEEALASEARRKDEFLAMLAHELRNPLAPIRNAVHLIARAPRLDERVLTRASGIIERQIAHLVRLVDDLLDVSRVSRGKITLQKAPVDLRDIARRAVETNHTTLDQRRHTLDFTVPAEPVMVHGDATRLVQVLDNLLNNAAKYTDEGGAIKVVVERSGDIARVRIVDNGRGIDPAAIPSLFDLFYQADRNLDRSEGGLGIGLSLVKSLVELHDGKVVAESEGRGRGSTFTVELPLAASPPVVVRAPAPASGSGRHLRILLVDDLPDTLESLAILLRLDGHTVTTAADGQAAIDRAIELWPDVILLDIGLPRVDGYDACRAIRDAGLGHTWIAALSGYGQDDDRRRSAEAGFDAHLVKPVDLDLLRRLLAERTQIPIPAPTPQ